MASELPDASYLPEFRIRGLPTTPGLDSLKTTPWMSSPSSAAENISAINELQRDGVLIGSGSRWKGKGLERDLVSHSKAPSRHAGDPSDENSGIIRMSEQQYDDVLKKNRNAALQYIDEDDGESIQVGSSLELRQRLAEPYPGNPKILNLGGLNTRQVHEFDIEPSQDVVKIWSDCEKRSKSRRDELEKQTTGPVLATSSKPDPPNYRFIYYPEEPSVQSATGSQNVIQPGPLHFKYQPLPYENRWASYQSLPWQMNAKPAAAPGKTEKEPPKSENHETTSHEMPSPPSSNGEDRSRQPLLAMFEAELGKLMSKPVEAPATESANHGSLHAPPAPSTMGHDEPINTTVPSNNSCQPTQPSQPDINPGELFANSLKSVFGGVMDLATSLVHQDSEVRQQLSNAQREISKNLDNALRRSAGAIDQLNESLVAADRHVPGNSRGLDTTGLGNSTNVFPPTQSTAQEKVSCKAKPSSTQPASPAADFQAEKIVGRRFICYDNIGGPRFTQYLVRWSGHDESQDVWYDVENLKDCNALVRDYEALNPTGVGTVYHDKAYLKSARDLHNRTAGDRMVTQNAIVEDLYGPDTSSSKWPPKARSKAPVEASADSDVTAWSRGPFKDRSSKSIVSDLTKSKAETQPSTPTRRPSVSLNDILNPPPTRARSQATPEPNRHLRHRQSWHPTSSSRQEPNNLMFNPASVMAKYPTVSELERESHSRAGENANASQPSRQPTISSYPKLEPPSNANKLDETVSRNEKRVSFATAMAPGQSQPTNGLRRAKSLAFEHGPSYPTSSSLYDGYSTRSTRNQDTTTSSTTHGPPPRRANTTRERPNAWGEAAASPMNPRRRSYMERSHAEVEKQNKIRNCQRQLLHMGFSEAQSSAVAASVGGNLDEALDTLEEDQAAWEGQSTERQTSRAPWANSPWNSFQHRMPGSFFPY